MIAPHASGCSAWARTDRMGGRGGRPVVPAGESMTEPAACDPSGPPPVTHRRFNTVIALGCLALGVCAMVTLAVWPPSTSDPVPLVAVRAALVYPAWLLLPGLPWVVMLYGHARKPVCPALVLAAGVGVSIGIQALDLTVLKLLGWTPLSLTFMGVICAESLVSLPLMLMTNPLTLQRPAWRELVALAIAVVALVSFGVSRAPQGTRRLADYWYDSAVEQGWTASDIEFKREGPWGDPEIAGHGADEVRRFEPSANSLTMVAETAGTVTVAMLLQAKVGAVLTVRHNHDEVGRALIESHPTENLEEGPVLRYQDAGIAAVIGEIEMERGDRLGVQVDSPSPGFVVYDMTGSSVDAVWTAQAFGLHDVYYYQILNIAENVSWARELLTTRYLTLHQPPLWSYFHAGAALLNGPDLPAAYFVFLLILFGLALVGMRLVTTLEPQAPFPALLVPLAGALCHGEHVIRHSEANFPDNLFALGVMVAILGLVRRDPLFFGGAGFAASILRYPGFAVTTAAAIVDGVLRRDGKGIRRDLAAMWIPLGVFCVLMLLAGAVSGRLGNWLWILHFETFPEHFHGDYRVSTLLPRIPLFFRDLLVYAGFLPLFALPVLGRGARLLFIVGLGYAAVLCAIDHFPIHYFLPLIALFAGAVGCNAAALGRRFGAWATHLVAWPALALAIGVTLFS